MQGHYQDHVFFLGGGSCLEMINETRNVVICTSHYSDIVLSVKSINGTRNATRIELEVKAKCCARKLSAEYESTSNSRRDRGLTVYLTHYYIVTRKAELLRPFPVSDSQTTS